MDIEERSPHIPNNRHLDILGDRRGGQYILTRELTGLLHFLEPSTASLYRYLSHDVRAN